jgi:uncharacterized phage protein (TIGR02218 family)
MIDIPAALQAKLDAGATTLAWCWVLTRTDEHVAGFTDHDRPLFVAGVTCEPSAGFSAGSARVETGSSPARAAVFGALNSDRIDEADLDNGVWDGAQVALYRVDWTEPALFFRAFSGLIGAVSRTDFGFEAEVSGLSAKLNSRIGRVFSRRCDAELGDGRCGVDLEGGGFEHAVTVSAVINAAGIRFDGAGDQAEDWFKSGVLRWTSGANAGASHRVRIDRLSGGGRLLELDPIPAKQPAPGDAATVTAGCDKQFATCRSKFANGLNFRGCPHMPGNDLLLRHAGSEDIRDGSAR